MATEEINSTTPARYMDSSAALAHQQFLNEFIGRLQLIGDVVMASFVLLIRRALSR